MALSLRAVLRRALDLSLAVGPEEFLKLGLDIQRERENAEVGLGLGTRSPAFSFSGPVTFYSSAPSRSPRMPHAKLRCAGLVPDTPSHPAGWTHLLRGPSGSERLEDGAKPHSAPGLNDRQRAGAQKMPAELIIVFSARQPSVMILHTCFIHSTNNLFWAPYQVS